MSIGTYIVLFDMSISTYIVLIDMSIGTYIVLIDMSIGTYIVPFDMSKGAKLVSITHMHLDPLPYKFGLVLGYPIAVFVIGSNRSHLNK